LLQISLALDVADSMCKSGSNVPIESFHPIIDACEQAGELHMVSTRACRCIKQVSVTSHTSYEDLSGREFSLVGQRDLSFRGALP
jgi:hypothetical protein